MKKKNMFFNLPDKIIIDNKLQENGEEGSQNYKNLLPYDSAQKNLIKLCDEWQQEYELIYLSYSIDGY
jgi:hypothetical protein